MSGSLALSDSGSVNDRLADDRAVAIWLFIVAAMIFVMVVIGGITRLTESGLSITEWQPVSGVLPPMDDAAWQHEFDLYKQIPEFQKLRPDMTLGEFRGIFWWEYIHRLWGRLIGVVFAAGGLWLLIRHRIRPALRPRLIGLFLLGGLQGALGWFMVKSGLSVRTDVSQYRLVAHLLTALFIYACILWTAFGLIRPLPRISAESRAGAPPCDLPALPDRRDAGDGRLHCRPRWRQDLQYFPLMGGALLPGRSARP